MECNIRSGTYQETWRENEDSNLSDMLKARGGHNFIKKQAVNMAVLKVADEPKPRSEACWLRRRGAEGEESCGRAELCNPE